MVNNFGSPFFLNISIYLLNFFLLRKVVGQTKAWNYLQDKFWTHEIDLYISDVAEMSKHNPDKYCTKNGSIIPNWQEAIGWLPRLSELNLWELKTNPVGDKRRVLVSVIDW